MNVDVKTRLNEMLLITENILRTIEEIRKADNRKRELEAALIEATLNRKGSGNIEKELEEIDNMLKDVEEKLRVQLKELDKRMEELRRVYNERVKESVGEIREIAKVQANA